jgi:glycosyltransferase involved in cell wall biosynthesis
MKNKEKSNRPKISMIGHKHIPSREGGVEIVVEELSTRMAEKGYEVTVYNRSGKHALDKNQEQENINIFKGVKIKKVLTIDKKGLAAMTSSFLGTIKILFSKNEVVHYHAEGPCVMIPIIKFFSNKRIIVTIHGLDWQREKWGTGFASKYIKFGEKMAVKYADEIIVLSENVKKYFKDKYGRETNFIPNGVNVPNILTANIIKEKYNLEKNEYFLFLGRIVPEKGIHYLIDAYLQIKTNKKLVIAGGASDTDDYFCELKNKTISNNNIIYTGFVQGEALQELYSNAYVYILPSDLEGMPLSLLEAMSYGNCCLTSNIPECANVIEDKGIIFEKSNVNDLKNKLEMLSNNEGIVNSYKSISQKYITEKYNWDEIVRKTEELYKAVKGEK